MKKISLLFLAISWLASVLAQNVGIGTNTPNTNAILDISSTNKAVLIPRLVDTGNVPSPAEGMMIYNKNTKAPFFHDGKQWLSLGARVPTAQPTAGNGITYSVVAMGFNQAEFDVTSATVGMGAGIQQPMPPSNATVSEFVFTKLLDVNSNYFQRAILQGQLIQSIEFKYYTGGSAIPYLSYRFRNLYFTGYSSSSGGERPLESVSVNFRYYGFKDWVNNVEFGWDVVNNVLSTY